MVPYKAMATFNTCNVYTKKDNKEQGLNIKQISGETGEEEFYKGGNRKKTNERQALFIATYQKSKKFDFRDFK